MTPRCGRPVGRYEAVWGPLLEDPPCGRPEGHNGPCRSVMAVARKHRADTARIQAERAARRREAA